MVAVVSLKQKTECSENVARRPVLKWRNLGSLTGRCLSQTWKNEQESATRTRRSAAERTHERQRDGGRARAKSLRLEGLGGHREAASVSGTWRRKGADGVG